ncbi:DUF5916 domain-containing protein [Sediminicola sp. 1XM1-17]|uniref:DUF5916 domain-containing protein n=1 Tax=Sediminicola sp. 1XM1-17 TaxID=3127702 RepID=UPI0030775AFA
MFRILFFFSIALFTSQIYSQTDTKSFTVKYTTDKITIDGVLDYPAWDRAESIGEFQQYFPSDSIPALQQTEIKMLYDDTHLYVSIKSYTEGDDYIIPSLRRDFRAGGNDNISLMFDTFSDGTNAFLFGTNPLGVQREALISGGGTRGGGFNTSWDIKWKGESKIYDGYYISEMAIPLSSFKFKEGETKWRFNSYRFDMQTNETSTWAKIPQNQLVFSLAFMGDMVFERPLGKSKTPLAIIPYVNTVAQKNYENDESFSDLKIGGDAKVAIGSGMNLDITLNPDFSNVEVDDVVTNLTRFEINLPEKRQFFIDNSDLFGDFGGQRDANPFFSRRIGIARDTAGNTIQNNILGGVRLSGKLSNDWRLGFLNIQTEEDLENDIASNNNAMLVLQKKVFSRSNVGMFFINRQTFEDYEFLEDDERYNRVLGIDYNLASADNTWTGKFYTHKSFEPGGGGKDLSTGLNLNYRSRYFNVIMDGIYIGDDFRSDLGFIRRTNIIKGVTGVERIFWPKTGKINNHAFNFFPIFTWNPELDYKNTDYEIRSSWGAEFKNQTRLEARMVNNYTFLFNGFDPSNSEGGIPLPSDQGYYYTNFEMEFRSDRRKVFSYTLEPSYGGFFNGNRFSFRSDVNLRFQPKVFLSLLVDYNNISLPTPYSSADIWLISPKVEITFSKSIFWSTLIQYSNQNDNLGLNSRLQWRFAPLSDLFIVYNDNYFVNNFEPKNRSINLKLTYWLNI